jgi:nucleotide-binding universal stress UspA family protein
MAKRPVVLPKSPGDLTFREVIVPLDGSPYAEHALPWAIQIATLAGARVRLVHVHEKMQPAFHARRLELYGEFDRLLREPIEEYIVDVVRRLARASSVTVTPTVVDGRHIIDDLSDLVASTTDIVVMATRGRNFVTRTVIGSALDAVVQRREAPILHVRGYSSPVDLTARPSLRHALVPLDGSSDSADVLRPVSALSKLTDGRQTLLRVIHSSGMFSCGNGSCPEEARELTNSPVAYLNTLAKAWRSKLPHVRTIVTWSDASLTRAILTAVDEQEVDFIAMTTRVRGRLSRLFRPGLFDGLVRRARTPILVVKRHDEDAQSLSLSA